MTFVSTDKLVRECIRFDKAEDFFSNFSDAWASARGQVWKLETRQTYSESGNLSLDKALEGKWAEAVALIPEVRKVDDDLYQMVRDKKLEFLRCRPIEFPLSPYLRWELEVYKYNHEQGERIFCCNRYSLDKIFEEFAKHDFMIFDARLAFVHDYDKDGLISGGWMVSDQEKIRNLISLYGFIKANCQDFRLF